MSENTEIRSALELLAAEPLTEQIDYYRKPFMVLWAAIQEAASDVAEDYDLPASPIHWSIGSRKKPWPLVPASPT